MLKAMKAASPNGEIQRERVFAARRDALVFCAYLALAFLFLLPGALHPARYLIGYPGDSIQHAWFLWHFARAASHGQNPFYTNLIFYPQRVNLAWSTTDPLAATMALPLEWLAGPIAAYNVSLILQLALAAFFAYLLCLRVCRDRFSAAVGGACFELSPFLMGEALGHLSLVTAFPIPLYVLTLDWTLEKAHAAQWRRGVALGLALFLTAMAHYNYTVFCVLATVAIMGVDLVREGWGVAARSWRALAVGAGTFAVLFAPFFWMMWGNPAERPRARGLDLVEMHSADALGWFVPSWNHVIFGSAARHWNAGLFGAGYEGVTYLGPVVLVLVAIGVWMGRRANPKWAIRAPVTALVFWALSLGPRVHVWGKGIALHGPEYLVYRSPFAQFISAPARFHVMAMLCVALLVAIGLSAILEHFSRPVTRAAAALATCALLALDMATLPFPVVSAEASVRHEGFGIPIDGCQMPASMDGKTVLTVPELEWPYPVRAMWMQMQDGGRYALADGYASYGPDSVWREFWSVPLLRTLRSVQSSAATNSSGGAEASLQDAARELNLGAVVVYDFPQRDAAVAYLRGIIAAAPQRQQHCTVFDLSGFTLSSSDLSGSPEAGKHPTASHALY